MKKSLLIIFALVSIFNFNAFAQPANNNCASATPLGTLPTPGACTAGLQNGVPVTVSGTTVGATATSPALGIINCQGGTADQFAPSPDVWYSFVASGTTVNINISGGAAPVLANPNIGLWTGTCAALTPSGCAIGNAAGNLSGVFTQITIGQTYYIQVGGATTSSTGNFNISVDNDIDCNNCNQVSSLTASPAPTFGAYAPGTVVHFCYTVSTFVESNTNWFHGLQISMGAGWTGVVSAPAPSPECNVDVTPGPGDAGAGTWRWYPAGVTSTGTGLSWPAGFYFDNANVAGTNAGANFGDPGNCGWTFCWDLTVNPGCAAGSDLTVTIGTTGDGESGSWSGAGCGTDPNYVFTAQGSCCPPTMASTPTCVGQSTGTATATPIGAGPFTYSWAPSGGTAATASGLAAGTYTVTVTNTGTLCAVTNTVTVTTNPLPISNAGLDITRCSGVSGTIGTATTAGLTYLWSPTTGLSSSTISNPTVTLTNFTASPVTTVYTVTTTNASGCTSTDAVNVTINPAPVIVAPANISVCAGAIIPATTITSTPAGATYTWTNSNTAIGLAASGVGQVPTFTSTNATTAPITGTITVTPTLGGCPGTPVTYTITINPLPVSGYTQSANQCLTGNSFTFTDSPALPGGYTQTWNFGGGGASPATSTVSPVTVTYTTPGTYTITHVVTAAGGCTSTTTSTVTIFAPPTAIASTIVNATCSLSNGSVTLGAVTGGTAPYTYSFNGSAFSGTTSYTGLAAGTYTVIVKDANGCTFTTTVTITNSPGPTALAVTNVSATCGLSNGIINIGVTTGGTAPYTYSVNGSAFTATTSYPGFAAGTYTVIVHDVNGCAFTTTTTIVNVPGPTALAVTSVNSTCGAANGVINIGAVTGGVGPYTYSVNGSAFTGTLSYTGFAAGTYTVIVKDANGCTFSTTVTVVNTPGPTAIAVTFVNANCGASNGTITLGAVTGGTAAYTYSVNGSAFTATTAYTGFAAGTYTVIVKDANGCTFTTTVTISNTSGPTALVVSSTNSTCGASNGTVTIGAVTGGVAAYTYSFNGGGFTATTSYTLLAAGTYTVVVKDINGCTFTTTVTVVNTPGPTALVVTSVNSTCGASNGIINIGAVTGGTAPYTYSVNASAFTGTLSYSGFAAGTYTVIVKDANGCTFTTTVTVTNTPGPTALAVTTVNSTCGAANGVINIGAVTGGTPAYSYSVNASAFTATISYTGFAAGTYTVIVKDANGCTFTTTTTVVNTPGPTALAATSVNSTCGAANGSVTIGAVTGGTAAFVYSFNGSPFTGTLTYSGLAAGTYTIIVKDANGCTFTRTIVVANTPGPTALATTSTNPTCGNANGTITIGAVTGGTAAYTYSFNGGGFTATTSYTGLAAGTYTIIVQDANGCQFTITKTIVNVPGPTALATSTTNTACGGSTGTITIGAVTGGTAAYTYSVNGSAFTATTSYTGFAANTYPVIVQDANGCQFATTATVANSTGPTALAVTTTNAACGGSTGTITIGAVTGGLAPYTYSVNGSAFTATTSYSGFAAGTYTVIVKDVNGCTFSTTAIVNPTLGPTALTVTNTNATCGLSNGTINIGAVTGGTAAYSYSVNGSAFTTTVAYTGFAAGTYTVIVKDANGCTFTTTTTIINVPGPTAIASTLTNTTCSTANGSVVLGAVTGGTPAYTYSFNGSPFTATTTYSALAAGTYTIIVKDVNGCTFTTTVTLTNSPGPTALAATSTNPTCGNANGTITIGAVTGGTPAYTYSFNGGGFTATTSYTGLAAGTYPIIVQDANGCQFTISKVIVNVPGPTALAVTTTNASCGASNGTATIGATTGGTAPYTYSFNGSPFTATTSYTGLAANSYPVIVQDANGCQFTTTAVVVNSSGPTALAVTHTDATCGASNGTVTIGATTGGVLPLSYSFNAGAFSTTTSYTGLAAGTYTVIVKDANGCTFTTTVTIANIAGPTALAVTNTPTTCGAANGTLTIGAVTGGTATYTYSVNASAFTVTTSYAALAAGTYTIVVKDANGCTFTTTSIITNTPGPTAIATTITNTTCGNSNGSVVLGVVTGGTSAYTYSFNGSPFTATTNYTGLAAGTYAIIVKDANGCTFTTSAVITNTAGPTALATTFTNPTCGNSNGTITIGTVTGGTPSYTYSFNGGGFTAVVSYTGLAAGTYPIIVQDANGCQFTTSRVIVNVPGPTALATSTTNASCGSSTGTVTIGAVTGGTAAYTYSFNGSAFTATTNYTGLAANSYPVIVQDANGCQFTTTAVVVNSSGPTALAVTHTDATCGNSNGTVTIGAVTGGVAAYSYSFNSSAFTAATTYSGLAAGTYTVIVKDANGCTFTTTVTIANIAGPTALAVTNTPTTCGAANGTLTIGAVTGGTAAYTYSVNASAFTVTTSYAALVAGTYTVVVKDANGCTFTTTTAIVNIPGPTAFATTLTNTTCGNSNGAVAIGAVTGGTPAYTYSFNGSPFTATTSYTGLAAGSYTIIVKDANGCTFTTAVNLTNTPGPTAQATTTNPSTCGLSNGAVNIAATTGGTPPYTYSFNGGGFTATTSYTGLAAGTYAVIVKDANGCTFTVNPIVTNVAGPTALATTITNSTCGGANGAILIGATTGGTPPYLYSVNGSVLSATTNYPGLVANTYTVVVQDANGCQFTTTATVVDLSGLTAAITAITNVSCFGGTNGSVTVAASGSTAPYSYSINGGPFGASGTFSGLTQGSYTVVAKDGNGCTVSVPVTISQPSVLVGVLVSQTNVLCFGGTTGAATVSASGGTNPYTYSIDLGPFVGSPIFTGLSAGTHTIVVKDGNGCTVSITVIITQPSVLALTTSVVNAVCTAANGSATVNATGGTPAYSYLWTPGGATTATDAGITAGSYSVLVTDFNGCTQTVTTSVGSNSGGTAVISSSTNVSCAGANNGTATVSMGAGATPPFTYAWTPGSQTTVTAVGLAPGTYNVTVTDGNGCISTTSVIITQPTVLAQTFTTTSVSCFGGNSGSITINPSGGTPGYSYFWTPGSFTTATISSLTAGTYTCVYTDANGCSQTASASVTQPTGMTLTETHVDANCSLSNGSASVNVTGGTGPYTYSWSTVPVQTTASATGLAANTYVCTVTDGNGCSQNISSTIGNLAGPVATIFSQINVSCFGNNDGAATVTVSGGVIPFTFLWTPGGQTLPTATNLVAGTYTLVATDVNGCIASTSVTITEPTILNLGVTGTDPTCFNACNGTLNSTPTGGTAPYTYLWSPGGMTTANVTGLCAGSYTLQVTDAHGCIVFKPYTLNNPGAVTATTTTTNVTCSGLCNGSSTVNPTSGTGPFTYLWSNPSAQTTQTATGLCAGTYTVTVSDVNGCTATATSTVTSPASMTVAITSQGNNTCFNACDGFASALVAGGSAPYTYNWMPGTVAGAAVNNLCAGTYTVTVTDLNGCSANTTVNISQPALLVASITSTNVTCFNACDGAANAVYTGGTGPYTFLWSPTFQTTPNIASICAGVYNLDVTDGNGCTASTSAVITQPTILAVSTTTTSSSCGNADGSACAAITGGVGPFTYSWNDPSNQTTSCANSINAGIYTISITDGNGCSVTNVANVNDITAPVVTIPTSANVTCFGAANGNAQAAISGGVVPYNILWTPTGSTTAFISSLSGGIYSVVVTDSIGCVGTASVTINEPATLVSGIIASANVTCNLSCNGSATVSAGGGTPPYTYLWNDAATQTTATATGLCAASYTTTVTDANGCATTSTATITEPPALNIAIVSVTSVTCNGGNDGTITVNVTGGTPGYTYLWTPSVGSGPSVTGLAAGSYNVKVTDQNGCANIITIIVTEPTAISLFTITNPSTCGNSNGFVSVSPSGGTPGYTYLWNDPSAQTTAIANSLAAGTYIATVTDNNGCIATTNVVLTNTAGPTISGFTFTEPTCYGTPLGTATVIPIGGVPLYSYLWSGTGAQITNPATALTAGVYTVVVTDQNGCTVTGSVNVTQPNPLVVIPSPTDTICIGANAQIYGAGYGGTPAYTYFWTPATLVGPGPIVVNPIVTTTYDVYVIDFNGCVSPSQPVTVFVNPPITVVTSDVSVCFGSSVGLSATANGGNGGPYSYSWTPPAGLSSATISNPTASPLTTTNYIVSVDDGCTLPSYSAFDTATVTVNPLAVSVMVANDTAGCEDFTVVFNAVSDIGTIFSWNFGDGSPSMGGEPVTYTYSNPGSYNVTLTVTTALGCVSSITNNSYIDVYPAPTAAFTYSPTTIMQTAPEVTFTDQSTGETTWSWDFDYPGGGLMDTLQNPVYSYPDSGMYVVQLIVTNSFGCTDTAYNNLEVVPEYVIYAPNAFTPTNHDGLNDTFMPQGVGIDPNNFEMFIFDRWGNQIFKTTDINKGWDGHANGGANVAQIDVYVWKINTKDSKANDHHYVGTVTLVK